MAAPSVSPSPSPLGPALAPDLQTFCDDARRYALIGEPLIAITTASPNDTIKLLRSNSFLSKKDNSPWPSFTWHYSSGLVGLDETSQEFITAKITERLGNELNAPTPEARAALLERERKISTRSAADALEFCEDCPVNSKIFVCLAGRYLKADEVVAAIDYLRAPFQSDNQMIILLGDNFRGLPNEFTGIPILSEPSPKTGMIKQLVTELHEENGVLLPEARYLDNYADSLLGLSIPGIRTAVTFNFKNKEAMSSPKAFTKALGKSKREALNKIAGLSVWEGGQTFDDIGGLAGMKDEFRQLFGGKRKPSAVVLIDEAEKQISSNNNDTSGVSQKQNSIFLSWLQDNKISGLIMTGIPGAGKTEICKAAGNTFSVPTVMFSLAKMQGSFVGQSETMLDDALKAISTLTDNRAVFIMTSNSMNTFPPELIRRFSGGTFFFDVPNEEERRSIWMVGCAKHNRPLDQVVLVEDQGWTGAEIIRCCERAEARDISLADAAKAIIPQSVSRYADIEKMRKEANGIYRSVSVPNASYEYVALPASLGRATNTNTNTNTGTLTVSRKISEED